MIPFFPTNCIGCGEVSAEPLCMACTQDWMTKHLQIRQHHSLYNHQVISCCHYNGLGGKLIRSFKYGKRFDALPILSQALSQAIIEQGHPPYDWIVPVPQSFRKLFSRGFHPVEMIAQVVSQSTKIPMNSKILHRKWRWNEKDQASLNRISRLHNLTYTFYAAKKQTKEKNQRIVLLDDVTTTGTTLYRCKEAILRQYPDWQVSLFVFSHG